MHYGGANIITCCFLTACILSSLAIQTISNAETGLNILNSGLNYLQLTIKRTISSLKLVGVLTEIWGGHVS